MSCMSYPLRLEGKQITAHRSRYQRSSLIPVLETFRVFTCTSKVSQATRVTPLTFIYYSFEGFTYSLSRIHGHEGNLVTEARKG